MDRNDLKINISNLKDGDHVYDFDLRLDEIDIDDIELVNDAKANVLLHKSGNQTSMVTKLTGKFKFQCDRCMEFYEHELDNKFEIIYKFDFKDDVEYENDEIKFISPNTNFIDLKSDIRDYILLSVPMRRAPEEKDGVCKYCHININEIVNVRNEEEINPVWEKLIKIKNK